MQLTKIEFNTIRKLHKQGTSIRKISDITGRDRRTVRTALNQNRKKRKEEKILETIRHSRKFTYSDLAILTGCSKGYILHVCKEYRDNGMIKHIGNKSGEYIWSYVQRPGSKKSTDLKPCPFCRKAINMLKDSFYCSNCDVKFVFKLSSDQLMIKKWNTRK